MTLQTANPNWEQPDAINHEGPSREDTSVWKEKIREQIWKQQKHITIKDLVKQWHLTEKRNLRNDDVTSALHGAGC